MTPAEIREARKRLGLNQAQMAMVLGYGSASRISDIERGVENAGACIVRLLRAYLDGYRPADWPELRARIDAARDDVDAARKAATKGQADD